MKALALPLIAAMFTVSVAAHAEEGPSAQQRYPPSSVRSKLIGGGLAVTGLAYGGTVLTATSWPDYPAADALYIPVAGPWISLAQSKCPTTEPNCGAEVYVRAVLLAIEGIVQLGGIGLIGEGVFMKTEPSPGVPKRNKDGGLTILPMPIVSSRVTGLGVVGHF